MWVIKETTQAL